MARKVFVVQLPAGYSFQDIRDFELRATTNSGVELINNTTFDHVAMPVEDQKRGVEEKPELFEPDRQVPCIELNELSIQESGSMDPLCQVTRKASLTTNKFPSVKINNAANFEQQRQQFDNLIPERLAVPQQEREFHSLPETNYTLKPVEISRPCSDTDVTTLPYREHTPLRIKGGEKIVTEEPCFESLSFSVGVNDEEKYYPKEDSASPVDVPVGRTSFYIPESDIESPTTPMAENIPSPFLMLEGPIEATENGMPSRKLVGSSSDLSYHLRNEYTFREFHSAMVFPSTKPLPKAGTGGQFPDVFVKYTCKPDIWPLHQRTENPMRYDVGILPKKSMNNVYYSLDETFAFKEEISKVLLIEKKEIFKKIIDLDPNMFVPIIAYLHCNDQADHQGRKCGYQIMEYYKDGSTYDLFEVNVNEVNCTCFLEIYHQKHEEYAKIKKERDLYRRPYMFSASYTREYQRGLENLDKQVSVLSNELENLVRNFNAVIVQMLRTVECLHFDGLVHRDIKPHNFLVKRMESCKCQPLIFCSCEHPGFCILLGDYDFVSFATNQKWDFTATKFDYSKNRIKRGTLGYRPIELNFDNHGPEEICDPKSDIYSLGVSILEIVAGRNWSNCTCENYIDETLKISLSPLSDKLKASTSLQQYQDKLSETYITLQEKNTILQNQGIVVREISEINSILASMCTEEGYTDIKHLVEQFKFIAVEKDDGIQTVIKTIIKAKYIDGHCAIHSWQVADSKWICSIIQRCINVCPQKRPYIRQLLQVRC